MKPGLRVACTLGVALTLGAIAEAQPRGIAERLRTLERQVGTQGQRITGLEGRVSAVSSRLNGVESLLRWYSAKVDCDAGGSLASALSAAPATAPSVHVTVSGTCHEVIVIDRDHVSIAGQPGATIDAPPGSAWGIYVNGGQDTRLDQLTVRGAPTAIHIRHAHVEGQGLHLVGGVTALMGSTVRFYQPTTIEAAPFEGVAVYEESSFVVFGCEIRDAGYAGVRVEDGTFVASDCRIERSGKFGVVAEHGANVTLDQVAVTDSGETGVLAGLGSAIRIQSDYPIWTPVPPPITSRIAGSPVGLRVSTGSSVRLGWATIEGNGDGISLGDSSVVERDMHTELRVTANSAAGVRCEPAPAVPQLVLIDSSSVFGNGGGDIVCAGY